MKRETLFAGIIAFAFSAPGTAGVQEGIDAMNRGDYGAAFDEFKPLAEAGDDKDCRIRLTEKDRFARSRDPIPWLDKPVEHRHSRGD